MMHYLDNNAGTLMPVSIINEINKWYNSGNPSASHATTSRKLIEGFKSYLAKIYSSVPDDLEIIFTSNASESNATILRSVAASYKKKMGRPAHIISSSIEHKSILLCLEAMRNEGLLEGYTLIPPDVGGQINPQLVGNAIQATKDRGLCLVSIMHANNETGTINDIESIKKICHANKVPIHTDAAQTAGKFPPKDIDAVSFTFYKCLGPVAGILMIKKRFMEGFGLGGIISGTQHNGFRGGTENIPMIAGSFAAYKLTMTDRAAKNKRMSQLKKDILEGISKSAPLISYRSYLNGGIGVGIGIGGGEAEAGEAGAPIYFVLIGENTLPNTILISIVSSMANNRKMEICNTKIKDYLAANNIVISIGSACNTSNKSASHVLFAMQCDEEIRKGTIRISLSDTTTKKDCDLFVGAIIRYTRKFI